MKISVVHSYYSSAAPSGENFMVDNQVSALAGAGHDVQLIDLHTDHLQNEPLYKARTALCVATGHGRSPIDDLKRFSPDVVHVHNLFPNYATNWLGMWPGPIVATMHNFRPLCSNGLLFRDGHSCTLCPDRGSHHAIIHGCYKNSRIATAPVAYSNRGNVTSRPLINSAHRIVVLSERSHEIYRRYGIAENKLAIIPNFIDEHVTDEPSPILQEFWLYAGRLTREKGILQLLEAWPAHEKLVIAGSGPQEAKVREIVDQRSNIAFSGPVERSQLLTMMSTAKGLVLPSLWAEGIPTVYLEALAAGKPTISRRGNSAADDIETWAKELVYDDRESLIQALDYSGPVQNELGTAARNQFAEKYTRNAWIQKITALYEAAQ